MAIIMKDYVVAGALTLPEGKASFDRAPLILRSNSNFNKLLQITSYLSDGEPYGKIFTQEDFQALVQSRQAIEFEKPFEASSETVLWVFRPNFINREEALEELRSNDLLLLNYLPLPGGSFGCLVRERDIALKLRDRWATLADTESQKYIDKGDWLAACRAATHAFTVGCEMTPERLARLILIYKYQGLPTRAEGYMQMARRSRGEEFVAKIEKIVSLKSKQLSIEDGA